MSVRIGDNGGIRIGPETVYGTATVAYVTQNGRSATIAPAKALLPSARLGSQNLAVRTYGVGSADGEIELAYDDHRAVIEALLNATGNLTINDYTVGDGSVPDTESVSIWVDYGGSAMEYLGCVVQSLRFEIQPDSPIVVTASFLGQTVSQESSTALTFPDEADIVWESDISTVSIGGTAMCSLSGTIEVQIPILGSDRHCLGGSVIKQPVHAGRSVTTATLNVELADDTGADSEAILALFLANNALGDIVIGDFTLSSCYMTGDGPALGEGITQFPINVEAHELIITTQA